MGVKLVLYWKNTCVTGCKCVILEVCFTGIENGKPKCIVNHEAVYDVEFLALGRQAQFCKVEGCLFFFSSFFLPCMHFIRIVEVA
jgi:hypothetical protein